LIFRRILFALMAIAAFSAAAAVLIIALAFALYALAEPRFGRAGAAASVAGAAALFMGLGGLIMALLGRRRPKIETPAGLAERAFDFLQQKPVLAALGAIGAGLMTIRNPKYLGEAVRAFFEHKPQK